MALDFGVKIEELYDLRVRKEELTSQLSEVNKSIDSLEYGLIELLEEAGLDKARSNHGTATLKVELYPQIKDHETFVKWCVDNGKTDMLQKRVSTTSFKEYFNQNNMYPDGVDAYNKKSISFRKAK